jgi:hypothetical protein
VITTRRSAPSSESRCAVTKIMVMSAVVAAKIDPMSVERAQSNSE